MQGNMRFVLLALAPLILANCSMFHRPMKRPTRSRDAFVIMENPAVSYVPGSGRELYLKDSDPDVPGLISKAPPRYPREAFLKGRQGKVVLQVLIAPSGLVKSATVLESDDGKLNFAAVEAAFKWVFEPPTVNGQRVAVWITIPFQFEIENE